MERRKALVTSAARDSLHLRLHGSRPALIRPVFVAAGNARRGPWRLFKHLAEP